jgi:hypothetical protein
MLKQVFQAIARFFAPAFELLGQLPPNAIIRLATPF